MMPEKLHTMALQLYVRRELKSNIRTDKLGPKGLGYGCSHAGGLTLWPVGGGSVCVGRWGTLCVFCLHRAVPQGLYEVN